METLENVKRFDDAVLIHVLTKKGKGYRPAEEKPSLFHGVGPFDIATGKVLKGKGGAASYTAVFGEAMKKIAAEDDTGGCHYRRHAGRHRTYVIQP